MSAATLPAMNKFAFAQSQKLASPGGPALEGEASFAMTPTTLERTLANVSEQVSQRAKELRMAAQPTKRVVASTAQQAAKTVHQTYGEAKADVVSQLLRHHQG